MKSCSRFTKSFKPLCDEYSSKYEMNQEMGNLYDYQDIEISAKNYTGNTNHLKK